MLYITVPRRLGTTTLFPFYYRIRESYVPNHTLPYIALNEFDSTFFFLTLCSTLRNPNFTYGLRNLVHIVHYGCVVARATSRHRAIDVEDPEIDEMFIVNRCSVKPRLCVTYRSLLRLLQLFTYPSTVLYTDAQSCCMCTKPTYICFVPRKIKPIDIYFTVTFVQVI